MLQRRGVATRRGGGLPDLAYRRHHFRQIDLRRTCMSGIAAFFSSAGFLPHGYCLLWRPDILALHVASDLIIAGSYFSIPLAIFAFLRRRQDLVAEHRRIALLFCVFILGCGLTHLMGVVVLWRPIYAVDGLIKAFTALMSIWTAIVLWPMLPRLLDIPSPQALARANAQLKAEMDARVRALDELSAIRSSLETEVERRTREIQLLARRFEIATEGWMVTVTEQDENLRYTWVHNARTASGREIVGRSDDKDAIPGASDVLAPLKRKVLETGEGLRTYVSLPFEDETRYYDLKITPAELEDGGRGLLVAAADLTEQKRHQDQLQIIMRELAHRAKNLLSLVDGLVRQTAKAEELPAGFVEGFGARLAALGAAHDLLIGRDWTGASIDELVDSQIAHLLPDAPERITIEGPPLILAPEAAQYLALALHELATNATKHGVLSRSEGDLKVAWRTVGADGQGRVELEWTETGRPLTAPARLGFGRRLLETLIPRALKGDATLRFDGAGFAWRIAFDAGRL
jgi:two-component sensor histidine kinase